MLTTIALASLLQASSGTLTLSTCQLEKIPEPVLCGTLEVPEDRSAPGGRRIPLRIVVLPALEKEGELEPVFSLAGGPGLAATGDAAMFATDLRAYRQHHAVVLVDQRGMGASNGLRCERSTTGLANALDDLFPDDYVRPCRADAERHADLRFYSTAIAADDLDAVRAALGYPRIHLLGLSYGTRLALVYARQHGDRVGHMVLWGTTPTWATLPLYHASNAQRAFDLLFEDCAHDADCRRDHPDLAQHFRELLASLRAHPAVVERDGEKGLLTAGRLADALRTMLYSPEGARGVPLLIDDARAGRYDRVLTHISHRLPGDDGAYLAIICSEDAARIDPAEARRVTAGTYLGDYRVQEQLRACVGWPRSQLPADYWDDVRASAPTLLIAGDRDPVTAPAWAEAVAQQLPRSTLLHVPYLAHLPDGLSDLECFDRINITFLDRGSLDGVDTSCLERMAPPPFAK